MQCLPQAGERVTAEVSRLYIGIRPQPAPRRHAEVNATVGSQTTANFTQKPLLVLNMFQHVKKSNGRQ